jgi:hypothetical protein
MGADDIAQSLSPLQKGRLVLVAVTKEDHREEKREKTGALGWTLTHDTLFFRPVLYH